MPARRTRAAVVEPQEGGEDALPGLLRHARPVVVDHQPSLLRVDDEADLHPRFGVAHGIGHQVAQGAPQIMRLGLGPAAAVGYHEAMTALDRHVRTQGRQLADHLIDQRRQVDRAEGQRRRTAFEAGVHQHLVHQPVQVLDIGVHAIEVLAAGDRVFRVPGHLQTETQPRDRRAQLVRDRADHLALDRQQALQMPGHVVEGGRQTPDRIGTGIRHAHLEIAAGDARSRTFQFAQALFQLTHQQIDRQADQRQPQYPDQKQQLRRIGVHLIQRPQLHDPGRAGDGGEHPDRVAAAIERHHRIALIQAAALIVVEVGIVAGQQAQLVTETVPGLELRKPLGLFLLGITHQFVDQQVDGGPRQLFADLLDIAGQHQPVAGPDQCVHGDPARMQRLDQHLAA